MAQHMISERCKAIEASISQQAANPQAGYQTHPGYPSEQSAPHLGYGAPPNSAGAIGGDGGAYMGAVYAPPPLFGQPHW